MLTTQTVKKDMHAQLKVGELFRGRSGQRLAMVLGPCVLTLPSTCRCPYAASVFQGTGEEVRLNLDLSLGGENETIIKELDQQVLRAAEEHAVEWFGKQLSPEQIEARYLPMCRCREGDMPRLRAKIDTNHVRVWNERKEIEQLPENLFKGMDVRPRLQLQTIWFHSNQFGCQVQATDLAIDTSQVVTAETECPF